MTGNRLLPALVLVAVQGALAQSDSGSWKGTLRDAAGKVCARATCKQMPMDAAAMKHAAVDFLPDPATAEAVSLFPDLAS